MAINKDVISLDRGQIKKRAAELHSMGYNCAQSVLCALAPELELDADVAFRLAEGFGAGMGGMSETCGAISGAIMVLGQVTSAGQEVRGSKGATYALSRELCGRFTEKNGSTICRELKGVGVDHAPLRSCAGCIDDAIDLVLDIIA